VKLNRTRLELLAQDLSSEHMVQTIILQQHITDVITRRAFWNLHLDKDQETLSNKSSSACNTSWGHKMKFGEIVFPVTSWTILVWIWSGLQAIETLQWWLMHLINHLIEHANKRQENSFAKIWISWLHARSTTYIYIITQVILAFWLVLAYDLLEDRCTIDVIITKFLPLCFKMAESFANLVASVPSVFFQLLQYSRQHPSFSAHWAALMTKTDLSFPTFSLKFVDFAVEFCFHCNFSF